MLQCGVRSRIFGERRRAERRQQRFPDQVQHLLHVAEAGGDGDDHILIGHHDAVLAERAIAAIRIVTAAPELVAVSLRPVDVFIFRIVAVHARRFGHPFAGNDLLLIPDAALQIQLAEMGDVLGRDVQTPAAHVDAARVVVPDWIRDIEWFEQARLEIFADAHAG